MGKKKRGHPDIEEILARPWCYYCERDFDDLNILISHQRAKHFKCERCGRRLHTAGGLSVHMNQVHKETLTTVENALPNRASLDVEIFGIEGIPEEIANAHKQRLIQAYYQAEAERRAATGNTGPKADGDNASKRPKVESATDIKKRLAEFKARKAEQAASGGASSGANTPLDSHSQSPVVGQSPVAYTASSYSTPQTPYNGAQGANYGAYAQEPYAQPAVAYQQPYPQQPGYPPQPQYAAPQPAYSAPPAGYQQPPSALGGPPRYTSGSPPGSFPQYPPPAHSPTNSSLPARPPSLPAAPGLPQRPSFNGPPGQSYAPPYPGQGPPVPAGGWNNGWRGPDHQNPAMSAHNPYAQGYNGESGANGSSNDTPMRERDDIDKNIDEILRAAEAASNLPKKVDPPQSSAPAEVAAPAEPSTEATEKKSKKEKSKMRMVYSDKEVSPEEKMAQMPRYAFIPEATNETAAPTEAQPLAAVGA